MVVLVILAIMPEGSLLTTSTNLHPRWDTLPGRGANRSNRAIYRKKHNDGIRG